MWLKLTLVYVVLLFSVNQCQNVSSNNEFDYEGSGNEPDMFVTTSENIEKARFILNESHFILDNIETSRYFSNVTTISTLISDDEKSKENKFHSKNDTNLHQPKTALNEAKSGKRPSKNSSIAAPTVTEEYQFKNGTNLHQPETALNEAKSVKRPSKNSSIASPTVTEFFFTTSATVSSTPIITTTISSPVETTTSTSTSTTVATVSTSSTHQSCRNCSSVTNNSSTTETPNDETESAAVFKFNLNYLYFLLLLIPIFGVVVGVFFCKRRKRKDYVEPTTRSKTTRRLSTPSWVFSEPDFDDEEVITLQEEKK